MTAVLMLWLSVSATSASDAEARAQEQFLAADFEKSVETLNGALATETAPLSIARLQVLKAQSLLALRKKPAARQAIVAALQAEPTLNPSADDASPDVRELVTEVREQSPVTVTLAAAEMTDASVRVDGVLLGPLPLTTKLTAGAHRIVVSARGGERANDVVVPFTPETAQRLSLALPALVVPKDSPTDRPVTQSGMDTQQERSIIESRANHESQPRVMPWVGAAGGVVMLGAGAFGIVNGLGVQSKYRSEFASNQLTVTRRQATSAQTFFTGGVVLAAAGAGVAAASIVALASGPAAAVAVDGHGASASFAMRF